MIKAIIFIGVLFGLLSFQQGKVKRIVIVAYREPELMYGEIKQVIELRSDKIKGEVPQICSFDTTNFDKKGDPIVTKLGIEGRRCMLINYSVKYDDNGKKLTTTVDDGDKTVYRYGANGQIIKSEHYTTSLQLLDYNIYKYDSTGDIMESDHYSVSYDTKPTKTKFDCDLNGFVLSIGGSTYKYLLTDARGNWTKRILINDRNELDTIIRKITYY